MISYGKYCQKMSFNMYPVCKMNGDKLWKTLKENGTVPIVLGQWMKNIEPPCAHHMQDPCTSIVRHFTAFFLWVVVHANSEFLLVDVGNYGHLSDGSIFSSSYLAGAINAGTLTLPPRHTLGSSPVKCPYAFIGDNAFS